MVVGAILTGEREQDAREEPCRASVGYIHAAIPPIAITSLARKKKRLTIDADLHRIREHRCADYTSALVLANIISSEMPLFETIYIYMYIYI